MKLFKPGDVIFTVAVVAASLLVWALLQAAPAGERLVVMLDGREIASLPLNSDADFTVSGRYTNVIRIRDGEAYVLDTDCPNRICLQEGGIQKSGQSIVCAPNKMIAVIEGGKGGDVDAITQ